MLEGLPPPTHLLVFGPKKLPELDKSIRGGYPWLQASHERRREAGQRQTHHRGRLQLTDEAKTNVRSAGDFSGTDSANILLFEEI